MAIQIARSFQEAVELGHRVAEERKELYTPNMLEKMAEIVSFHIPDASIEKKQDILFAAVYEWTAVVRVTFFPLKKLFAC